MASTWLTKVYDFTVERREIPRRAGRPLIPMKRTQIGVLHTTEGFGVNSAWNTLNKNYSAPHFIVGDNRIVQCRPVGVQAAALRGSAPHYDNQYASVQVEMCGFTGGDRNYQKFGMKPWIPVDETLKPLVALMAYCSGNGINIPLQRPSPDWMDDCSDVVGIWAIDRNTRRTSGVWPKAKGWYYHMEVPHNNHYDCGAMRWTEIVAMAMELLGKPYPRPEPKPDPSPSPKPTPKPTPKPAPKPSSLIRRGDRGVRVKQLQARLIALGMLRKGGDDGIFGPRTLAAVRRFQRANGLRVDGIVGPATTRALNRVSKPAGTGAK